MCMEGSDEAVAKMRVFEAGRAAKNREKVVCEEEDEYRCCLLESETGSRGQMPQMGLPSRLSAASEGPPRRRLDLTCQAREDRTSCEVFL